MLANDQRKKSGVGADFDGRVVGQRDDRVALQERLQLAELLARRREQLARLGMRLLLLLAPVLDRIAAVQAAGDACGIPPASRAVRARRSRAADRPTARCLRRSAASARSAPDRGGTTPSPWADVVFEVVDVAADRLHGLLRRVGEVGEQVQIVETAKRLRQIGVDEGHRRRAARRARP